MQRIMDGVGISSPYLLGILPLLVALLLLSGCATAAATTAAGAAIGAETGHDKTKGAAIGAVAGFVVGETINYFDNKAQREAFLAGYEKGRSDAVKQQYWIARDNQRQLANDGFEEAFYEIPVPQSDRDGVRREPTTRVIRVVAPKEGQ